MKWMVRLIMVVLLFPVSLSLAMGDHPRTMQFDPVEFHPPQGERIELPNGMILYLMEDHRLPLIRIDAMIRVGRIYDPPDRIGLAGLTGVVLRTGGTHGYSGDAMDEELEFLAAEIHAGIGLESGTVSLDVLTKDFDRGLELFSEILRHPIFDDGKVALAKKRAIEQIRRRNDSPSGIASREFRKAVFGPDHPHARLSSIQGITSLTREDLLGFYARYFVPNSIIMGITGDFQRDQMVEKIRDAFGTWERRPVRFPDVEPVPVQFRPAVYAIERDINQTHLRMGHVGIRRKNPDYYALSVMNSILGGAAFTSRLFQQVRTEEGLAYSVGSFLSPGNFDRGVFLAYAQTKAETTHRTIQSILEAIRKIQNEPVSNQELSLAKESFLNSFVFSFSSPARILNRRVSLEYYGLPPDFLESFRDNVAKVTSQDIQRVARQYLHPEGLVILAVGKQESFDQPLSVFGKIRMILLEDEPYTPAGSENPSSLPNAPR